MKTDMHRKPNTSQLMAGGLLLLGCITYSLPWLMNPGNGLTFGAYDLAEWTSLHPAVRGGNPALLTALLLRVPLACLGLIVSIGFLRQRVGFAIAVIVLTGIALLPPLEFFTQFRDDPNYQQQFILTSITVAVGIASMMLRSVRLTKIVVILLAFVGAIGSVAGLLHGYALLEQFKLPTQFGLGGISLTAIFAISTLYFFRANQGSIKQTE
jgi:hypothetical protein